MIQLHQEGHDIAVGLRRQKMRDISTIVNFLDRSNEQVLLSFEPFQWTRHLSNQLDEDETRWLREDEEVQEG